MPLERKLIDAVLDEKVAMVLEFDADIEKEQDPELVEEFKAARERIIDAELKQLERECAYHWTVATDDAGEIARSLVRYQEAFTEALRKRSKGTEDRPW